MLKQSWVHEHFRVLLLELCEVGVGLLLGDTVDKPTDEVQCFLLLLCERQVFLDLLEVFKHFLLLSDASLECTTLDVEEVARVSWQAD